MATHLTSASGERHATVLSGDQSGVPRWKSGSRDTVASFPDGVRDGRFGK
ncbi:hypothetical protein BJ969_001581 [Saccharopolyspora gloriosae]|uniref:Uncharacterized protein n=1 Tax=Saccharopolyspora gloriosae TaxID=455344 RepID=A0A840NDX0_9PSEU|nr:hypothetical protein [Saccharopolyspora gloriosae]